MDTENDQHLVGHHGIFIADDKMSTCRLSERVDVRKRGNLILALTVALLVDMAYWLPMTKRTGKHRLRSLRDTGELRKCSCGRDLYERSVHEREAEWARGRQKARTLGHYIT